MRRCWRRQRHAWWTRWQRKEGCLGVFGNCRLLPSARRGSSSCGHSSQLCRQESLTHPLPPSVTLPHITTTHSSSAPTLRVPLPHITVHSSSATAMGCILRRDDTPFGERRVWSCVVRTLSNYIYVYASPSVCYIVNKRLQQ